MIRTVLASLVAAAAFTGCATFTDADAIARVDDAELSQDLLDDLTTIFGPDAQSPVGTGTSADAARNLITQWLQVSIVDGHLDEIGVDISDEARAEALATIDGDPSLDQVSEGARAYLLDAQAAIVTFNQLPDPQASFESALADADIHVDARYGFFDPQFGLLPLGLGLEPGF
ncbi:MAG: hypothetical protein AAFP84_13365 [Actinomycetota bacterium]